MQASAISGTLKSNKNRLILYIQVNRSTAYNIQHEHYCKYEHERPQKAEEKLNCLMSDLLFDVHVSPRS